MNVFSKQIALSKTWSKDISCSTRFNPVFHNLTDTFDCSNQLSWHPLQLELKNLRNLTAPKKCYGTPWHPFFEHCSNRSSQNFNNHNCKKSFLNLKWKAPMSFQNIFSLHSQLSSPHLSLRNESSQHRFLSNWVEDGQEKLPTRRTEFNGLFTWFTIPEKEVYRVPFFSWYMRWEYFFCTYDDVRLCKAIFPSQNVG